ncbi:MAG: glycerol-3-phosphate 1-O-acyltransferase [Phycisphaerales bacterium]|nr:glycerol-3-phosphate 1-O-acyltransferase [Phycisphaerales bacterium]
MLAIGFVAGSIPFGLILGRTKGIDIREHGSKNIGATNVGRVLGRKYGVLCFVLDALKGALPVLAVWCFLSGQYPSQTSLVGILMPLVGVAAILGHVYSPWVGFRGGKGVATSFGALAAMWPLMTFPALGALILWIIVLKLFRFVSLASICAALSLPLFLVARVAWTTNESSFPIPVVLPMLLVTIALAILVVWKHRPNIARLRAGTEPRVGTARPTADSSATLRS